MLPAGEGEAGEDTTNLGYDTWTDSGSAISQALFAAYGPKVIFMTARPEEARAYTMNQLRALLPAVRDHQLLMSASSSPISGSEFKPRLEQLLKAGILPGRILLVFEVRSALVKAWRKLGVTCYQTSFGDY